MTTDQENTGSAPEINESIEQTEKTSVQTVVQVVETERGDGGKERTKIVINNNINVTEFLEVMERYFGNRPQGVQGASTDEFTDYCNAISGLAPSNLSKKEGFSIAVEVDAAKYQEELNRLIKEGPVQPGQPQPLYQ